MYCSQKLNIKIRRSNHINYKLLLHDNNGSLCLKIGNLVISKELLKHSNK